MKKLNLKKEFKLRIIQSFKSFFQNHDGFCASSSKHWSAGQGMHSGSRAGTSGVQGQLGLQTNHVSKSEKLKKKKKSKARCDGVYLQSQLLGGEGSLVVTEMLRLELFLWPRTIPPSWASLDLKDESGLAGEQTDPNTTKYGSWREDSNFNCSLFCSAWFVLQTGSLYAALPLLEVAAYTRLALN